LPVEREAVRAGGDEVGEAVQQQRTPETAATLG